MGSTIRKNEAVGHILRGAYADSLEITNSKKAYEVTDKGIRELSIDVKMSAFDIPDLIKLIGTEFTIDKFDRIKNEL